MQTTNGVWLHGFVGKARRPICASAARMHLMVWMLLNSLLGSEWDTAAGGAEQLEMHSRGSNAQFENGLWSPTVVLQQ